MGKTRPLGSLSGHIPQGWPRPRIPPAGCGCVRGHLAVWADWLQPCRLGLCLLPHPHQGPLHSPENKWHILGVGSSMPQERTGIKSPRDPMGQKLRLVVWEECPMASVCTFQLKSFQNIKHSFSPWSYLKTPTCSNPGKRKRGD